MALFYLCNSHSSTMNRNVAVATLNKPTRLALDKLDSCWSVMTHPESHKLDLTATCHHDHSMCRTGTSITGGEMPCYRCWPPGPHLPHHTLHNRRTTFSRSLLENEGNREGKSSDYKHLQQKHSLLYSTCDFKES